MPLDSTDALASSAKDAGALYNAEADYVDNAGASIRAPLELQNPTQGIGLTGTIKVPRGSSDSTDVPDAISLGLAFDAARDLVLLNDGSGQKVLFNPHGTALDLNLSGAIKGNVEVSVLKSVTIQNGRTDVEVTAERMSADGSRHEPVLSVPVRSDGSFTLYPLATDTGTPSSYDLVIHGPAVATVIVRGVTVAAGAASASTTTSIGTIAPRDASSFNANLAPTSNTTLPAGAVVRFYQTIPGAGEVPYTIDQAPIDPLTRKLATDISLSDATIDVGSFVSSGTPVTLAAQTPSEGAAVYKVAGSAPLYADGAFSATVTTTGSSASATVAPAALGVAPGAIASTLTASVTQRTPIFDRGELILSHDGAIIDSISLQPALVAAPGTLTNLTVGNLPGGNSGNTFDAGLYYLSMRVWSSANPAQTFQRDAFITPLDLRGANSATISVPID